MISNKKLSIVFIISLLVSMFPTYEGVEIAYAEQTLGGPKSWYHVREKPNDWVRVLGPGSTGERWILNTSPYLTNDNRQKFHTWHLTNQPTYKMGAYGLENPNSYTAPEGWEVQDTLKYPVYRPRTYPLSIRDCTESSKNMGQGTAKPEDYVREGVMDCHPYEFEIKRPQNAWVKDIARIHWDFDRREETWEGKTGPFYIFDTAEQNGFAYDIRIKPKGGTEPGPGPEGECSIDISSPSPGGSIQAESTQADASGVIRADYRGNELFDVLQGIPTSETLYANAFAKEYLFKHRFTNMTGRVTFNIKLKKEFELIWTENNQPKTEKVIVEKEVKVEKPYSYWQIDNLEVYGLQYAEMMNYALPGEYVMLNPNGGYSPPNVDANNSDNVEDHVIPPACPKITLEAEVIDGQTQKPIPPTDFQVPDVQSQIGQVKVKNDRVMFNGQQIMSDSEAVETAPTPSSIPEARMTGQDVFYEYGLWISNSKVNRANTPSSGNVYYNQIIGIKGGQGTLVFPILGINPVTVHTPVVIYADVSDDAEHNQRTEPDYARQAVILDRPFTVYTPTTGQHRNIPGYGYRDYAKYTRSKEVKFPFDVYKYENGNKGTFYPANTWIDIPVPRLETEFFTPVWVDEGAYNVDFRTIAENAPYGYTTQPNANLDLTHHAATDSIPIDVIGRVYDFRVTDIADYAWELVFRIRQGHVRPSGNQYWVQDREIDGEIRGNETPYLLPIMPGSHPIYRNISVKTGYHFKFDLKTKGNMFGEKDGVRITPTFYFVDKQGNNRQEVDLYYKANNNFVKIGDPTDQERRYVILNERLRNVPQDHILNAGEYAFDHYPNVETTIKNRYLQNYLEESKKKTWVGKFDWMILPYKVKTHIGPKQIPFNASVNPVRANASIQQWYGEYSLPAAVYTVKKGTNLAESGRLTGLTDKSPVFLKDGYILVNFNIETIRDQKVDQPHLQYIYAPLTNQWKREGYQDHRIDPYGNSFEFLDGDVLFYHGDLSSYDDFKSNVTH